MMTLAIKFILAHLLGDFVFQPSSWVKDKQDKKIASRYLYYHIGLHLILMLVVVAFERKYWIGILLITLSHFAIDCAKLYLESEKNSKILFFADQLLHLLIIAGVVYYYTPYTIDLQLLYQTKSLLLLACLAFTTYAVSVLLKIMLERFAPDAEPASPTASITNNAGKYIGILERLFIFFFVVINFWEGVGFLLAAKSIFRFGDLKDNRDVRLTEYILIGTLLSFAFGISAAIIYKYLLLHI